MDSNSKTFCVNPYITLHSKLKEGYNPCCLFKKSYNLTIEQYLNSEELSGIKHQLDQGTKIKECESCWKLEANGIESKRLRDNKTYLRLLKSRISKLDAGNFAEYYVRLGNHCNIKCVTCSDTYSSTWISELKKHDLPHKPVVNIDANHEIWQHIKNHSSSVGVIEFIGGEPFMMNLDSQQDLLSSLITTNNARHIRLKYNTNGTKIPYNLLDYWEHFKVIELNVSVDGVGDRFEYLRFPAKWNDVVNNIEYFKKLRIKTNIEITLICTLSILNIGYIKDIVDFANTIGVKVWFNILHGPIYYNLYNFPKAKNWILSQIDGLDIPTINAIRNSLTNFNSIDQTMEFKNQCVQLDLRRNTSVEKTFNELYEQLR